MITGNANLTLGGTTPTLTIGDAGAEDTKLVFDGNAQDFYVGLDDSADDLVIGKGSTVGTTPALSIDENLLVTVSDDVKVAGRSIGTITTDNDGSFDLAVSNDFKCTPSGDFTLTFTNGDAGQSGNIFLINSGGHTVSAHADVAINATALTALATAGTYHLAYFCSVDSGTANTIAVSVSGAFDLMSLIKGNHAGLGGSGAPGGALGSFYSHTIGQSLRFEEGGSAYLTFTPSSNGTDNKKYTFFCMD